MTRNPRAGKAPRRSGSKASDVLGRGPMAPGSSPPADDQQLPLPHERDTSTGTASTGRQGQDAAGARQRELLKRAAADLAEGQVDTDLRASPGLDAQTRERLLKKQAAATSARSSGKQTARGTTVPTPGRRPKKP